MIEKIRDFFPEIKKIILYGSKARGDFLEDSDIDLLFVIESFIDKKTKYSVYDFISELKIKYGLLASTILYLKRISKQKK